MNNPLDDFLKQFEEKSKKRKDAQKNAAEESKAINDGFDDAFKDLIAKIIIPSMTIIKNTLGAHGLNLALDKTVDSSAYINVNYVSSNPENKTTCRIVIVGNHDLEKVVFYIDYPDSKIEKMEIEHSQEEITLDLLRIILLDCVKRMVDI